MAQPDRNTGSPLNLTIKAWPEPDPASSSISALIGRLQTQRGHFRDTTVERLKEEIARGEEKEADGGKGLDENSDGNGDLGGLFEDLLMREVGGEGAGTKKTTADEPIMAVDQERREMLVKGREEIIAYIGMAHHEAMLALDFISLIVSLHQPEVGSKTMSPTLKELVPTSSLGLEKIHTRYPPNTTADDRLISKGWKTESLDTAGNSLMAAATRLKNECDKERNYWEDVISIREDGWNICRLPREKHTLGVRYGFTESAPEYTEKGVGALRIGEDGRVIIQDVYINGADATTRKAVRVHIINKDGLVIGQSRPFTVSLDSTSTLRDRIEAARNFIYEDELFFEIMREARVLASFGIKTSKDSVTLEIGNGKSVVIDMASIEEDPFPSTTLQDDTIAHSILLALRLLLSYGHRIILHKRSRPALPLSSTRKNPTQPFALLRPVISHLMHQDHLNSLTNHLTWLHRICTSAGLFFDSQITPLKNCFSDGLKDVDSTFDSFLGLLETEAIIHLPGGWKLTISMRTLLTHPFYGTGYIATTSHDGVSAKLMGRNSFASTKEMELYILWCLERSVVNEVRLVQEKEKEKGAGQAVLQQGLLQEGGQQQNQDQTITTKKQLKWEQQGQGNRIQKHDGRRLKIATVQATSKGLTLRWGFAGGRDSVLLFDGSASEEKTDLMDVLREI